MSNINVTYIPARNKPDKQKRINTTLEKLFTAITRERRVGKKDHLPLWSPCIFKEGGKTDNASAIELSCLVWDFDVGIRAETVLDCLGQCNFAYFAHSSFSNTTAKNKFRVIIPLLEPICSVDWSYAWHGALEFLQSKLPDYVRSAFGDKCIDLSCKDARRFYYVGGDGLDNVWSMSALNKPRFDLMPIMEKTREKMFQEAQDRMKRIKSEHAKYTARQSRKRGAHRDYHEELKKDLQNTAKARAELAHKLTGFGGKIISTQLGEKMCVDWICPRCQNIKKGKYDPATYFYISPYGTLSGAYCQHLNSCGWRGSLYWLATEHNLVK